MNKGKIIQIIGPVVDVEFKNSELPSTFTALLIKRKDQSDLILEVQQHLGENRVRAIAMDSTDGLQRAQEVINTGKPISVPVGKQTLGRLMNVVGAPIDELGEIKAKEQYPIHR
ncbi:MAG: F0F1 ATP synthase subunit beta, partial [Candidatus Cloacimonadia bacterium]